MRGKRRSCRACWVGARIIPAHAGQTRQADTGTVRRKDHPRACGANCMPCCTSLLAVGSSPRMRGKPPMTVHGWNRTRIIPAHAGQTCRLCSAVSPRADHPRACGANVPFKFDVHLLFGSSPRMRGKHPVIAWRALMRRIIPAHAGQTAHVRIEPAREADHPRACGANGVPRAAVE